MLGKEPRVSLKTVIPTLASQNWKGNGRSRKPLSVFSIPLKVFEDVNLMLVVRMDGGREEAFSASTSKSVSYTHLTLPTKIGV